jgi:hypothetical protein
MPRKIIRNKKSINPYRVHTKIPYDQMFDKLYKELDRAKKIVEERRHQ